MFGIFSKNRRMEELENKLNLIEKSLLVSFQNIKYDVHGSKTHTHYRFQELLRRLERIESELFNIKTENTNLISQTSPRHQDQQDKVTVETFSEVDETGIAGKLTEVQQNILMLLAKLHIENPDSWIPAKQLGNELYPQKRYESIRPMISTYLDVLEELNLVRKLRKRRQVFTRLTTKGISHINPHLNQKIKPIIKKQRKSK
ncbi:MAG: hypothetical protein ABIB47_02655 [Candidatus Woesearchaeota archaeon]